MSTTTTSSFKPPSWAKGASLVDRARYLQMEGVSVKGYEPHRVRGGKVYVEEKKDTFKWCVKRFFFFLEKKQNISNELAYSFSIYNKDCWVYERTFKLSTAKATTHDPH
jgi:hypothetical protein